MLMLVLVLGVWLTCSSSSPLGVWGLATELFSLPFFYLEIITTRALYCRAADPDKSCGRISLLSPSVGTGLLYQPQGKQYSCPVFEAFRGQNPFQNIPSRISLRRLYDVQRGKFENYLELNPAH